MIAVGWNFYFLQQTSILHIEFYKNNGEAKQKYI